MSPNQKTDTNAPQNPSAPGTPEWHYDEIMRHIEPDLMTVNLNKHAEMYKDETAEQRSDRMRAYDKAFEIFDNVCASFDLDVREAAQKTRSEARAKTLEEERSESGSAMKTIEDEISNS